MLVNKRRDEPHGSQSGSPQAHRALFCTHFGCSGGSTYYWGRCNRPRLNGLIPKEGSWPLGEGTTLGQWLLCFTAVALAREAWVRLVVEQFLGRNAQGMSTNLMSGAQVVLECLTREKVEVIFGYPGGVTLPFYDAIYDSPIKEVLVRH